MNAMADLASLHTGIDARVASIRQQHPDWPCAKGCDNCCRQLAALPQLSADEWSLLQEGLAKLPQEQLAAIKHSINRLGEHPTRPVTCPLLDPDTGACPATPSARSPAAPMASMYSATKGCIVARSRHA